jgi:hypothetical protein
VAACVGRRAWSPRPQWAANCTKLCWCRPTGRVAAAPIVSPRLFLKLMLKRWWRLRTTRRRRSPPDAACRAGTVGAVLSCGAPVPLDQDDYGIVVWRVVVVVVPGAGATTIGAEVVCSVVIVRVVPLTRSPSS